MTAEKKTVGVLAMQGDFEAHRKIVENELGQRVKEVRSVADLAQTDALILPGGESTAIIKLLERNGLDTAIRDRAASGMPLFGTCAGMILLSKTIDQRPNQPTLGLIDMKVARNAFGRQVDSFEADIPFTPSNAKETSGTVRGVFIRAPYVMETGPNVEILSLFDDKIVAVRQGNILATAFHPELTHDVRVHRFFLKNAGFELPE